MARILLTAFAAYDEWRENASWLVLQSVMREQTGGATIVTRRYPVDFEAVRDRLASDLAGEPFDAILCLGQAPGRAKLCLEAFALNSHRRRGERSDEARPLEADGPAAYRSVLPLAEWTRQLRDEGVPTELSTSAGDYLCNAALYWVHYFSEQAGAAPRAAFVHVPLDLAQAAACERDVPSMATEVAAHAVRRMIEWVTAERLAAVSGGVA